MMAFVTLKIMSKFKNEIKVIKNILSSLATQIPKISLNKVNVIFPVGFVLSMRFSPSIGYLSCMVCPQYEISPQEMLSWNVCPQYEIFPVRFVMRMKSLPRVYLFLL